MYQQYLLTNSKQTQNN